MPFNPFWDATRYLVDGQQAYLNFQSLLGCDLGVSVIQSEGGEVLSIPFGMRHTVGLYTLGKRPFLVVRYFQSLLGCDYQKVGVLIHGDMRTFNPFWDATVSVIFVVLQLIKVICELSIPFGMRRFTK